MEKKTAKILLCILIMLAGGCDDNTLDPVQTQIPASDVGEKDSVQDYLADLWEASNHGDWDVISGMINPITGGVVSGVPDSWPAGFVFSVDIPPKAIPGYPEVEVEPEPIEGKNYMQGFHDSWNERLPVGPIVSPVLISIYIPRYYDDVPGNYDYPAVYLLEPHSLEFTKPVEVTFCFPPWLPDTPEYYKFHFWREGEEPDWTYYYSDLDTLSPQGADPRTELVFETLHFSRWGVENGSGGGSGKSLPDGMR